MDSQKLQMVIILYEVKRVNHVAESVDDTYAVTRKYVPKKHTEIAEALRTSFDETSKDWVESFDELHKSVSELERHSYNLDTAVRTSQVRVTNICEQLYTVVKQLDTIAHLTMVKNIIILNIYWVVFFYYIFL